MPSGCSRSQAPPSWAQATQKGTSSWLWRNATICARPWIGAETNDASFGLELAVELQNLWNITGPQEGLERMERLLDAARAVPMELRAGALRACAGAADLAGHDELAAQLAQEGLELYEQLGDEEGIAVLEHMMAVAAWRRQDWDRMRELTEHSLDLARGRFTFVETTSYWLQGQLELHDGNLERAVELTRPSAEMARAAPWPWWESGQRHELLMLALQQGNLDEAEREGLAALEMERTQVVGTSMSAHHILGL